ncbi:MAG: T9SS type A sorting domain-containing protein, partial [Bacteroidales bacterium]|nr:T9SS type A sorting domain-containing protein [Bacteroidales bacterium]
ETYTWNGQEYTQAGEYTYTTKSEINGCDSIVTLTLTVNPLLSATVEQTICEGETYTWNGQEYTQAGEYTYTTQSKVTGCDSTVTLILSVNPKLSSSEEYTACYGETYTWNGQEYTQAGEYSYTTQSEVTGCDSVVTLTLNYYEQIPETFIYDTVYFDTITNEFSDTLYSVIDSVSTTLQSEINGCDSVVTTVHVNGYIPKNGLNDAANNIEMSVYPNPTTSDANLSVSGLNKAASIVVTDIQGKVVFRTVVAKGQKVINIPSASMPSGTYYVQIICDNKTQTRKLIKR